MFRNALCLWLKSHGLTEAECDQVCADRRVALSLKLEDAGGMLDDVRTALYSLRSDAGRTAVHALNDPGEQLLLMQHLNDHVAGKSARQASVATPKAATDKLSDSESLLQRICREMELTRSEYKLLYQALA